MGLGAITHPPTLINVRKMVGYVDLKDILQNGLKWSKNFCLLYDIWLVISFFQIGCKIIERLVLWMSWCTVYVVFRTLNYIDVV